MNITFGEALRRARIKKGLSQQQLAEQMNVDRSSIASWEINRRTPDFAIISKLAVILNIDTNELLISDNKQKPVVIMVDDEKIILGGGIPILKAVIPNAEVIGFTKPSDAIEYAKSHNIDLAFLDIEMGMFSGLELCRELLRINFRTNVIYLTAYMEYSFDAWSTGACGFLLKPLTEKAVSDIFSRLRYPILNTEVF